MANVKKTKKAKTETKATTVPVEKPVVEEKKEEKVKKPAVKKATAKPAVKTSVTFEFGGKQVKVDSITKAAAKEYGKKRKGETIKTLEVYVVAEENAAYYVVNGEDSDDFKIEL
ncbi:DUF6465 family protein [Novisyntrophococcus fermenticellae]|uniref:DUF6465 family protein n=1 Tax=Novisyntrophococcus fermenticellae TaxID=2068655 RepID=UPI001E422659|nr:DUF6465 family protein [Novisyntrophococcus fermenticellae]